MAKRTCYKIYRLGLYAVSLFRCSLVRLSSSSHRSAAGFNDIEARQSDLVCTGTKTCHETHTQFDLDGVDLSPVFGTVRLRVITTGEVAVGCKRTRELS